MFFAEVINYILAGITARREYDPSPSPFPPFGQLKKIQDGSLRVVLGAD